MKRLKKKKKKYVLKIKRVNFNYKNKYIYLFREREKGEKKDRFGWNVKSYPFFRKQIGMCFVASERIQ